MKKIMLGVFAVVLSFSILTSCSSIDEYDVPTVEFEALAKLIKEKGSPTPNHPHESHRMEDSTYILTLAKEGKEIRKHKKNTYRTEIISPITP